MSRRNWRPIRAIRSATAPECDRRNTYRMECPMCALRFSVDQENFHQSVDRAGSFTGALAYTIFIRHDLD
jgi:hypothetical protein